MALGARAGEAVASGGDRNVVGPDLEEEAAVTEVETSALQEGRGWCRVGSLGCVGLVSTQNTFPVVGALRNRHRLVLFQIFELCTSERESVFICSISSYAVVLMMMSNKASGKELS